VIEKEPSEGLGRISVTLGLWTKIPQKNQSLRRQQILWIPKKMSSLQNLNAKHWSSSMESLFASVLVEGKDHQKDSLLRCDDIIESRSLKMVRRQKDKRGTLERFVMSLMKERWSLVKSFAVGRIYQTPHLSHFLNFLTEKTSIKWETQTKTQLYGILIRKD